MSIMRSQNLFAKNFKMPISRQINLCKISIVPTPPEAASCPVNGKNGLILNKGFGADIVS